MELVFPLLRYIIQIIIVYFILRYLPYCNLETIQALMVTFIITIFCIIVEKLTVPILLQSTNNKQITEQEVLEKFEDSCSTCKKIEHMNGQEKQNNKQCKVVCTELPTENKSDDKNKDENKTNNTSEKTTTVVEVPEQRPTNDDRFYWGTRYGNLGYDDRYGFGGMFYDEYPFYNRYRNNDLKYLRNIGEKYNGVLDEAHKQDLKERELKEKINTQRWEDALEERANETDGYDSRYQQTGTKSERLKTFTNRRRIDGVLDDEMPYTDYNHLPVASGYKSHDYEYGYSFLPPEKWYPQSPRPPVCVTEKRCPVCPVLATGSPVDAKEWHTARRITPPDLINTDYIGEKLNSGR